MFKKRFFDSLNGEHRIFERFKTCTISNVYAHNPDFSSLQYLWKSKIGSIGCDIMLPY